MSYPVDGSARNSAFVLVLFVLLVIILSTTMFI
ncbi:sporulation protein YjcZ [Gorillibacterium massiliense]|nr:sporulation protein YjcZ [Gorillibacterium massiliense]